MSDPIFLTEINDTKGNYLEIKLPTTDYDLLDALDRLNLTSSENPACTIYRYNSYSFLARATDQHRTLFETNALARKLSEFDSYKGFPSKDWSRWKSRKERDCSHSPNSSIRHTVPTVVITSNCRNR